MRSLSAALGAVVIAAGLFAAAGIEAGWHGTGAVWRWAALTLALCAWALVLVPWRLHGSRWTPAQHQRGMHRALGAWAVTDVVVVLAWGT